MGPPPTSSELLSLCNLPPSSSSSERQTRILQLRVWLRSDPARMTELLLSSAHRDKKTGCMPLHWAAGTGFDEVIALLLNSTSSTYEDDDTSIVPKKFVDQLAHPPSTSRTPLHYAARNGHLHTCQLLIESYAADAHPKCSRGSVTPLQLAVWQNRLRVVRYLLEWNAEHTSSEQANTMVHERNAFHCGLMHWIGLVPRKRWGEDCDGEPTTTNTNTDNDNDNEDDGSGVLPLARYLHSLGVSYESTPPNCNTQGHTPMHKSAWGGNLPLIQYFRHEHGVCDTVQDGAGNYCADIAKMRSNREVCEWLLQHGSGDRAASCKTLDLDAGATLEEIRRRYRELARVCHPDKAQQNHEKKNSSTNDFLRIKAAYEHLTKEGGRGTQKNKKFDEVKLLENHRRLSSGGGDGDNNDDLFLARLLAVISDYGEGGFPVSLIARRWNQVWPDRPSPPPDQYIIERKAKCKRGDADHNGNVSSRYTIIRKRVKLLKFLKWKCRDSSVSFQNIKGDMLTFDRSKIAVIPDGALSRDHPSTIVRRGDVLRV